eukprot:12421835-Heterocapsa_arctica.AAC.1
METAGEAQDRRRGGGSEGGEVGNRRHGGGSEGEPDLKLEGRQLNPKKKGVMSVVEIMKRSVALNWSTATRRRSR